MGASKKLFIGLDVGSESVGWAATDEDYNLLRLKGKTAWGARIFSQASNAQERRAFRTAGRRLARRKQRIELLNTLFEPLLNEKDPTFLLRLRYSRFFDEDKPESARSETLLFKNKAEEKAYYQAYPTIWHLRESLLKGDDKAYSDIRLIYLAIHHIIKYRGNFLRTGEMNFDKFDDSVYESVNRFLQSLNESEETPTTTLAKEKYDEFTAMALNGELPKGAKKKALMALFDIESDEAKPFVEMFCTLCSGGKFDSKKLSDSGEYGEVSIEFNSKYEDNEAEVEGNLGEAFELVQDAKAVFDYATLHDILNGRQNLSPAFVSVYEAHKEQLKSLKSICHEIDAKHGLTGADSLYVKLFNEKDNPKNYVAFTHTKGTQQKRCDIHDLNRYVLSLVSPFEAELFKDSARLWAMIKHCIDEDRLFQTIALRSTSVIPMQLHQKELKAILNEAEARNIPGISAIKDKVLALFKFRVPYYCGPLTNASMYSNIVFKTDAREPIRPWNFDDLVDLDATKKKFMDGLTNKCTYLKDCNVLPKESILFQDYDTYNKLDNLTVNGSKLTPELKTQIFDELLSLHAKTTVNAVRRYLAKREGAKLEDVVVSGLGPNDYFVCSSRATLSPGFDLSDRNGKDFAAAERIILLKTIFVDSKSDAKEAIQKEFPNLSEKQQQLVNRLSCKGWSPLSKEFLLMPYADDSGVIHYLLDLLKESQENLNQILSNATYGFKKRIRDHNDAIFENKTPKMAVDEIIENLPPQMRRSTIQAIRIVEEVSKVAKKDPSVISIEVTRENDPRKKEKMVDSRKEQLRVFLKNLTKDSMEAERAKEVQEELEKQELDALRGKHLFLYFLQNGRDLYSGKPIDINDIFDATKYDTDHIIPQSKMKDDSIENLALVSREVNQERGNRYPLPISIRNNKEVRALWTRLHNAKMMSDKKYNNLIRSNPLTEEELQAFVAAQINIVNRSNVAIRDALRILYPQAKLIFSKAAYPSQIRKELSIPKLRDLNDTHHAVDAYLNIVAGESLDRRFGNVALIKAAAKAEVDDDHSLNMEKFMYYQLFSKDGFMTELAKKIDANSRRHDFLLTYRFNYADGAFYDQTVYSPGRYSTLYPMHDNENASKYGGYNSLSAECNVIATVKGKKTSRYLLAVPHLYMNRVRKGENITDLLISLVPHKDGDAVSFDFENPIDFGMKLKKGGCCYLCLPFNAGNAKLSPVSPIFLSRDCERYVSSLQHACEKSPIIGQDQSPLLSIFSDKNKTHSETLSKEKTKKVLEELRSIAQQSRFEYSTMLADLRSFDRFQELLNAVDKSTFAEQLRIVKYAIGLFTRKSEVLSNKKYFPKSRGAILQEGFKIVSESITGLYSEEKEL